MEPRVLHRDADVIDPSSSHGPSACGQTVYPQLTAPGVGIRTTDLYHAYANETGTSIAAPHVSGTLALLLDAFPDLSADRQAAALEDAALDLGSTGPDNTYGFGRLDALAAYNSILSAIAAGRHSQKDMGGVLERTASQLRHPLELLESAGFVHRIEDLPVARRPRT